jgi:hypothetical protein
VVEGISASLRHSDFDWHLRVGADFLAGQPYRSTGNPYLLGRLAWDGLLATVPPLVAHVGSYLVALVAMYGMLCLWRGLSSKANSINQAQYNTYVAISLIVLGPFLLRDLDECGLQTLLLWLLIAGGYALSQGKKVACGACLAAAATYKVAPLLMLPFLLWKRQWKSAGSMTVFLVVLNLAAPACYLGWREAVAANEQWVQQTSWSLRNMPEAYPSVPGAELPKPQNLSLRAMLARYVESYPPGHTLFLDHPLYIQFGAMPPARAKLFVNTVLLVLGGYIAWCFRGRWNWQRGNGRFAYEWAVVCLFCALLSPVCWKQHLVLALPVVLLASAGLGSQQLRTRTIIVLAIATAVFWLFRHGAVGRELSIVLLSYKFETMALLMLAWHAGRVGREAVSAEASLPADLQLQCKAC